MEKPEVKVSEIIDAFDAGKNPKEIMEEFGVSQWLAYKYAPEHHKHKPKVKLIHDVDPVEYRASKSINNPPNRTCTNCGNNTMKKSKNKEKSTIKNGRPDEKRTEIKKWVSDVRPSSPKPKSYGPKKGKTKVTYEEDDRFSIPSTIGTELY